MDIAEFLAKHGQAVSSSINFIYFAQYVRGFHCAYLRYNDGVQQLHICVGFFYVFYTSLNTFVDGFNKRHRVCMCVCVRNNISQLFKH